MKKLVTIITLITVLLLPKVALAIPVAEDGDQVETDSGTVIQEIIDPALQPSLKILPQNYPEKIIKIEVEVKSLVSSGKVGITWVYPKQFVEIVGSETDIVTVTNGNSTFLTKEFKPVESAIVEGSDLSRFFEIGTRVNAFIEDRNYLSATAIDIQVNGDMEVLPQTSEYKNDKNITLATRWGVRILVTTLVIGLIAFGVKKFIDYINAPDVPKY